MDHKAAANPAGSGKALHPEESTTTVLVIGAGISGICAGAKLRESNIPFVILEKAEEAGGTWRDNIYPGAACDTQSHHYSFSFRRNPGWSRKFAEQPEILAYLKACTTDLGVREHIRFGQEVTAASFDEARALWRVETVGGQVWWTQFLISAVGQLNRPSYPEIKGVKDFGGKILHTALWDQSFDLSGKTVAVIGTGASAVQLVPRIVDTVQQLHVFQRSPNWVASKSDRPFTEAELRWFRRLPVLTGIYRKWVYWKRELTWPEFLTGSKAAERAEAEIVKTIGRVIPDARLRARLKPDYPIGCKRVLLSNDYYPALTRPNARLVTSEISHIDPEGIETADGERHKVDVIAFATGFRATEFLMPMTITGCGSHDLQDFWIDGAMAYLGLTVPRFPNLFLLYGPNTNLGHSSIIFMIECQVAYVMKCLNTLKARGRKTMEVREDALSRFLGVLDREMSRTSWVASCSSWYKVASGRVVNNWSTNTYKYWWRTRLPNFEDYHVT